ncbi:MAG: integrin alpha [Chloroflexi bacterium]|nr:integrin alpha [Chloroflexota bacterium]
MVESNQLGAEWGAAVSGAGDLNADGFDDMLVGAPAYDTTQPDVGMVFAFYGSASGPARSPGWQAESYQMGSRFGFSVNGAGDFNHDGYADIVIGASHFTNDHQFEGGAFVFLGGPSGLSTRPAKQAFGEKADASFAYSVAGAGDVNGDRYSDLIVGSPDYRSGDIIVGRVFAYHGREISFPTEFFVRIPVMLRSGP